MLGAIIGDIIGSRFEWDNLKDKEFVLFTDDCYPTDDSIMTLATAKTLSEVEKSKNNLNELIIKNYQELGREYPFAGYGAHFFRWILTDEPHPYNSLGNGSAMRVSPCGWFAQNINEAEELGRKTAEITHNHPEGIKGAEVISKCIFLARTGHSKKEILEEVKKSYPEDFLTTFTIDNIRESYSYNETCPGSVPQAIEAFLEAEDFEDAIRNAISIGGDSDTIAAITGSIAEAYYDIPKEILLNALEYLDETQLKIIDNFYKSLLKNKNE